jgi:hypothetical protein
LKTQNQLSDTDQALESPAAKTLLLFQRLSPLLLLRVLPVAVFNQVLSE